MREIKFRAWNPDQQRWESSVSIGLDGHIFGWSGSGIEIVLHQFTGQHDKNGVEIYEGDVVQSSRSNGRLRPVIYSTGTGRYNGIPYGAEVWGEVIGNIYENPDLLQNAA